MAVEADKVVVELIAKTDGFDQKVKASASSFGAATNEIGRSGSAAEKVLDNLKRKMATALKAGNTGTANKLAGQIAQLEGALGKLPQTSGRARMGMQQLGFQFNDVASQMAQGTKASTIFAQQSGQVIQALQMMGGEGNAFLKFLGGPWGIALSVGAVALTPLISKLLQTKDGVSDLVAKLKEHYEQSKLSDEAHDAFAHTVEGSIAAVDKLTDALKEQNLTLEDNIALKKADIASTIANVVGNIGTVSSALANAVQRYESAKKALADAESGNFGNSTEAAAAVGAAQDMVSRARADVDALTAQLNGLSVAAQKGAKALGMVDFPLIERNAQEAVDPIAQINRRFDDMADAAKKAGTYTQALATDIERQRKAALDAAEANDRFTKSQSQRITDFKSSLIGAEGTGANRMGSSAAGFGQFMPATWRHYFDQAYPGQSGLADSTKQELRNNQQVAKGVIDVATDDYVKVLERAGQQITEASLYTMHMLSAGDPNGTVALRLLRAPAGASARSIVGSRVAAANGNIFTGTAGQARDEIGRRIGDSSSTVSAGASAIERELGQQAALMDKINTRAQDEWNTQQKITVEAVKQNRLTTGTTQTIDAILAPALAQIDKIAEEFTTNLDEARAVGGELVDDIFNPDNWTSWGDLGKRILHDLEMEFIKLAAINPLKNLINGNNSLPTITGVTGALGSLFGGGSPGEFDATWINNFMGGRAGGGPVHAGQSYIVGEDGPEIFMPSSAGTIIPNHQAFSPANDRAAAPFAGMSPSIVRVMIEASKYFDGRVMEVTGPTIAQASVGAANGGAIMARRNLSRETQHRLE